MTVDAESFFGHDEPASAAGERIVASSAVVDVLVLHPAPTLDHEKRAAITHVGCGTRLPGLRALGQLDSALVPDVKRRLIDVLSGASSRTPDEMRRPFSYWSVRKLADYLSTRKGRQVAVGRERFAADPDRRGNHLPTDQDVEGIAGPVERIEAGPDRVAARTYT